MKKALNDNLGWISLNAIGLAICFLFDAWLITPRSEVDSINGIDVISCWITTVFPTVIAGFVLNTVWLVKLWKKRPQIKNSPQLRIWFFTCLLWIILLGMNGVAIGMARLAIDMIDGQAWHR